MQAFVGLIQKLLEDSRVRYLVAGGTAFACEYGSFIVLINVTALPVVLANGVSFIIGLLVSFYFHLVWTFAGDHRHSLTKQLSSYVALALINLALTSQIIWMLTHGAHIAPAIAKIICMGLIIVWNYLVLNRFIFRHK